MARTPQVGRRTAQLFTTEIDRAIKVVTLELVSKTGPTIVTLLVNPTDITITYPARTQIVQTLTEIYAEEWGMGARVLTMSGITGYRARVIPEIGKVVDGYTAFRQMRDLLRTYLDQARKNRTPGLEPEINELRVHLWEDNEHYVIALTGPEGFKKIRSAQQPLLYAYSLTATILEDISPRDLTAAEKSQAVAYQRAANALSALTDSQADLNTWAALNTGGPLAGAATAVAAFGAQVGSFASSLATTVFSNPVAGAVQTAQSAVAGAINIADAAAIIAKEGIGILGDTLIDVPADLAIQATRGARRAVCAAQNLTKLDGIGDRAFQRVSDVQAAYASATDTPC